MVDDLAGARALIGAFRYSGDRPIIVESGQPPPTSFLKGMLFRNSIEISASVTPSLARRLDSVCDRLQVPRCCVTAFVYSSREIRGECFGGKKSQCLMRFSSGLVDLLEDEEFEFVVGHELGHYLFDHQALEPSARESAEYFLARRAQEISVDRVGLLACRSIEVALRALMKTVSGLTGKHLRFDTSTYIAQLQKIDHADSVEESATHPPMLIRSRALLWFSLSSAYSAPNAAVRGPELKKMDARIELDLRRFVDGAIRQQIETARHDILMWRMAFETIPRVGFSPQVLAYFSGEFGHDIAGRLQGFLDGMNQTEVESVLFERVRESRATLESLLPNSFMSEMSEIEQIVSSEVSKLSSK